jgi:hypothetical protein
MKKIVEKRVVLAEAYRHSALGPQGNANYMLLRQYQFPWELADSEKLLTLDSDQIEEADADHVKKCFKELGVTPRTLECWLRKCAQEKDEAKIFIFLKKIMKADESIAWTGWRIMGSVLGGHCIFTWQLFAKDPQSDTKVYTGDNTRNVGR